MIKQLCAAGLILAAASMLHAAGFYLDGGRGDDSNPGTEGAPWRTLAALSARAFGPGDSIAFECGSSYSGTLEIPSGGTLEAPLLLTSHGLGPRPSFSNPGRFHSFRVSASYVEIDGLEFRDSATMTQWYSISYRQSGAVLIDPGADHVTVKNCAFVGVGVGVKSHGLYTKVLGNDFHDLVIAYADRSQPYGAIGVSLNNSLAEVAYNSFVNCRSTRSPYGADGGAVEIEGYANASKDGISIHHNRSKDCQGFLEVTETASSDVDIYENVSDDYQQFVAFDTSTLPSRFRVHDNTVLRTRGANACNVFAIFYYRDLGRAPESSWMSISNNIFYTPACKALKGSYSYISFDFPHSGNLFYDGGPDPVGYPLGPGDIVADPGFVDFRARDLRLVPGSPAIGKGASISP
jgi:hypothetical protein